MEPRSRLGGMLSGKLRLAFAGPAPKIIGSPGFTHLIAKALGQLPCPARIAQAKTFHPKLRLELTLGKRYLPVALGQSQTFIPKPGFYFDRLRHLPAYSPRFLVGREMIAEDGDQVLFLG